MYKARKIAAAMLMLAAVTVMLTGCLPGMKDMTQEAPAGFLDGVWHGWCAPVSLVLNLCGMDVHMYETVNTGFSYELGFYMAVISGFGGLSLVRKKKRRD